ncbi:heterokaryon incompatibility protein-domain-containing protein [Nemania sp. FL0031]|nr:heterokaryon incompatibility protein-domain-containing protein [Nemania sp. FL0031]
MDAFEYQQLDLKSSAFRLVRLLNGVGDEEIECDIIYTTLDDNVIPYEAVSYTWGSPDRTCNINVESRNFEVTSNLWNLLRGIRQAKGDRYLWIDAISINQDDDLERGHQVQRMQTIYSGAERVLFYLGETTKEITILMDTLYNFQGQVLSHHPTSDEGWRLVWEAEQAEARKRYGNNTDKILQYGLQELLNRPWFSRVWILQEVANAPKASLCCGTASVHAQIFAMSPRLLRVDLNHHSNAVFQLMPTYARERSRKPQHADLWSILIAYSKSEASDSRDKIFALLGLCADQHISDFMMPSYTDAESTVVRAVIRYILTRGYSTLLEGLPSPDWLSSVNIPSIRQFLRDLVSFPRNIASRYMENSFIYMLSFWPTGVLQDFLRKQGSGVEVTTELVDSAFLSQSDAVRRMTILLQQGRRFNMNFLADSTFSNITYDVVYRYLVSGLRSPTVLSVGDNAGLVMHNRQKIIYRFLSLIPGGYILNSITKGQLVRQFRILELARYDIDIMNDDDDDDDDDNDKKEGKDDDVEHRRNSQFRKWTSLVAAVIFGKRCEVALPLDTEPEEFNPCSMSATLTLYFAMYRGHIATSRYLLEKGVKIVIGWLPNPLAWVAHHRDIDMIEALREHPESIVGYSGRSALHSAAEFETVPVIRFLLEQGADAKAVGEGGMTAASVAHREFRFAARDVLHAAENGKLDELNQTAWRGIEMKDIRETIEMVLKEAGYGRGLLGNFV